jgi:hypothetical protein
MHECRKFMRSSIGPSTRWLSTSYDQPGCFSSQHIIVIDPTIEKMTSSEEE